MHRSFTLEYWIDDGWYVGRLKEIPGIFSQGESIYELEENIKDAYMLMMQSETPINYTGVMTKEVEVEV
ncbi:MAG: type II toxin-antitoxin system HicB family antitoxin [Nitrospirae bacterium]|nr:type II toxin-antitoxin system HicB family antitoxin [Nitrospirota bacterium]